MSTTVTYKGNALTTVSNATKTLNTSGKWMEGDLTLTDSTTRVVTTTVSVTTNATYSLSFEVVGEPTILMFMRMGNSQYDRHYYATGIVSGIFDGSTCYLTRDAMTSVTSGGTTSTYIHQWLEEGTYDYTAETVTITSTTRFPIGTYTVMYAYEP